MSDPNLDDLSMEQLAATLREAAPSLQPLSPADGVERYLKRRQGEITERTREEYRRKLAYFLKFCELRGVEDLNAVDGRLVDDYRVWRRDEATPSVESLSPKTMRDDMLLFRAFLRYLESVEAIKPGLAENVIVPDLAVGEGVRDVELEPERVAAILDYLGRYRYASREHVVWLLHCRTGRRPGAIRALDVDDVQLGAEPYLAFRHRPGTGTRLKNGATSEGDLTITSEVATVLGDYIETQRVDVTDEYDREPLLSTPQGRMTTSAMRYVFYAWSRPCTIGAACPHGKVVEECAAANRFDKASQCPSSQASYAARHGHITQLRRLGLPKSVIAERCEVSEKIIEKHYDERSAADRRKLQRDLFAQLREQQDDKNAGYV